MDVANLTVRDCTVYDRLLTSGKNSITPGSAVIEGCTFINERITDDLHVATVCSDNIVFKDNRIEGYPRGVNMQGTGSGEGSFSATGNTFVDLFSPGQGAIQFADGIDGVSLELARGIAETELYLREGWTEPSAPDPLPYGLLFHQTLAALKGAERDLRFRDLCDRVLSLAPFSSIAEDDYRLLLKHMVNQRTLVQTEDLTLLIGPRAEALAFGRDFPAVFEVRRETEIRSGGTTVGTVQGEPNVGAVVALAGRVWMVTRRGDGWADAVETDGEADSRWRSDPPAIHTRIMRKVRDVLSGDDDYPYLDSAARRELASSRDAFAASGAGDVFVETDWGYDIYPWLGTVQFDTLWRMLDRIPGVRVGCGFSPVVLEVDTGLSEDEIRRGLDRIREEGDRMSLIGRDDDLRIGKFDRFVPGSLLAESFCARRIDWDFEI